MEPVQRSQFFAFCLKITLIAFVPAYAITIIAFYIVQAVIGDANKFLPPEIHYNLQMFFEVVVFAPITETFVVGLIADLLTIAKFDWFKSCLFAGIFWGFIHSLMGALAFVGISWAFMVLTYSFMHWKKVSYTRAYWAACIPHALYNLIAFGIGYLSHQ